MSHIVIALLAANCFLLGMTINMALVDRFIIRPQRELTNELIKGYSSCLDLVSVMLGVKTPQKNADGSMVSPIQIKKEE